jgi:hypothetical protein
MRRLIDLIFDKAVLEAKFCSMYAELCLEFTKREYKLPEDPGECLFHPSSAPSVSSRPD